MWASVMASVAEWIVAPDCGSGSLGVRVPSFAPQIILSKGELSYEGIKTRAGQYNKNQ